MMQIASLHFLYSHEGYSGKIHSAVLEMKTDTNEKYLAISSGSCADLDIQEH